MTTIRVYDTEAKRLIKLADEETITVAAVLEDLMAFAEDNGYFNK